MGQAVSYNEREYARENDYWQKASRARTVNTAIKVEWDEGHVGHLLESKSVTLPLASVGRGAAEMVKIISRGGKKHLRIHIDLGVDFVSEGLGAAIASNRELKDKLHGYVIDDLTVTGNLSGEFDENRLEQWWRSDVAAVIKHLGLEVTSKTLFKIKPLQIDSVGIFPLNNWQSQQLSMFKYQYSENDD
jgi:hypothetical protein